MADLTIEAELADVTERASMWETSGYPSDRRVAASLRALLADHAAQAERFELVNAAMERHYTEVQRLTKVNKALGLDLQKAWAALETAEVMADVASRLGEYAADIRASASALAAQPLRGDRVYPPEGWVLVPQVPTEAMLTALNTGFCVGWPQWKNMLSAAPSAPASPTSEDVVRLVEAARFAPMLGGLVKKAFKPQDGDDAIRLSDGSVVTGEPAVALCELSRCVIDLGNRIAAAIAPFADRVGEAGNPVTEQKHTLTPMGNQTAGEGAE